MTDQVREQVKNIYLSVINLSVDIFSFRLSTSQAYFAIACSDWKWYDLLNLR